MTYSSRGRYRDATGTLTVGGDSLVFARTEGFISKRRRVTIAIPLDAIVDVGVEGMIRKKLVVLVDGRRVPGIPRHEFDVPDPYHWMNTVRNEMAVTVTERQPAREVHVKEVVREVVKVPCKFCGTLVLVTDRKCLSCGASIG